MPDGGNRNGKVIKLGDRRSQNKLAKGFWQFDYLLFPSTYQALKDLPSENVQEAVEITLHPGNAAPLLVNPLLQRILALSPREVREAIFVTPQKILRFKYSCKCAYQLQLFTSFLKTISHYVRKYDSIVLDNLGRRCWFPGDWLEKIEQGPFNVHNHLTIHTVLEREDNHYWIHTHGLVQFACPDLEVRMVGKEGIGPTLGLVSRLAHYLLKNGPVFKEGCRVALVKGHCWVTFKYCREPPEENHYQNDYFRILIHLK